MTNVKAVQVLTEIENGPDSFMILGREKGKVLTDLIDKHRPKSILEVGTNLGYSAILMASHISPDAKITTLEIGEIITQRAKDNIKKAEFEEKIKIIVGDALETIKTLEGKFDFVFLDAAKKEYLAYLKLIEENLPPNAIVVADNVGIFASEVQDYLTYVKQKYKSETIKIGEDAMEISTLQNI